MEAAEKEAESLALAEAEEIWLSEELEPREPQASVVSWDAVEPPPLTVLGYSPLFLAPPASAPSVLRPKQVSWP